MGKMNELARESDDGDVMEGDYFDPQERAYYEAFGAMKHILSDEKFRKVFGGLRFDDFTRFIDMV